MIEAVEEDEQSKRDIAKRFKVSYDFVCNLCKHYQMTDGLKAKHQERRSHSVQQLTGVGLDHLIFLDEIGAN